MLTRFKRQLVVRGAQCAGGLLLLSAPLVTPAIAQGEKIYRPQMVAMLGEEIYRPQMAAMLAETRGSMAYLSQELAEAGQYLAAIEPTMAHLRIDLADPVLSDGPLMLAGIPDPDDSLFSAGREALNRNNFRDAARLFEQLRTDYPSSNFVPSAMYWEAFSRYRLGGTDNLRQARQLLQNQIDRYPNASTHNDALTLAARLDGELARRGDAEAARGIAQELQNEECAEGENDVRIAALNALMNSNPERALPILQRVLQRRDPCSVEMRKTALFVISQQGGDETAAILMDVVANDPDADMRGSAVFWLSQNPSPETIPLLDSLLRYSTDDEIREKALFALAQQDDERAAAAMRAVIQDPSMSNELRGNAIFWLGQNESPSTTAYMRELYASLDDDELREQVLFAVSQSDDPANGQWLVGIATDPNQPMELRKNALFWAGQSGVGLTDLLNMWDLDLDPEMKEQLVFVYSQSDDPAALDKLFEIARTETDKELRENAIFWLGQSDDPRVTAFLEELINN